MVNKNMAFHDFELFPAISGSCSGLLVTIICGSGSDEPVITVDTTVDCSPNLEDTVTEV